MCLHISAQKPLRVKCLRQFVLFMLKLQLPIFYHYLLASGVRYSFFFLTLHLSFLLLDKRTALTRQCNAPLVNAGKPA